MGIGFTIDTPIKISHLGINSVISLVDDILLEKFRKMYSGKYQIPYTEIPPSEFDHRAKRITAYLDMVNHICRKNFDDLKQSYSADGKSIYDYLDFLPEQSAIKKAYIKLSKEKLQEEEVIASILPMLSQGCIEVNIMTKVDKTNYQNGKQLPARFNDAHAALRGFANSRLESSVVLSAGMNPSLYAYMENFKDFFPDENFNLRKKVTLKVSDYKSAIIQGKYLAKRGIWVSEYRIESGLNCGGHAFATNGLLMGPILNKFKQGKEELIKTVHHILIKALKNKGYQAPDEPLPLKLSVQGGVGTSAEHDLLLNHYDFDSVGWGSPFLLVPEATAVDDATLTSLQRAGEEDLYLSNTSPLGVPFNSLRGNTKDVEKERDAALGKAGSRCPKKYVALNFEFTSRGICTASRLYQLSKLKELEKEYLPEDKKKKRYNEIIEKSCICVGLGTSALIKYNMDTREEGKGVSVCPGPNMAYFSGRSSIRQMIDHIYGRKKLAIHSERPHMFIKEMKLYFDYLNEGIRKISSPISSKQHKQYSDFINNLQEGIEYYLILFSDMNIIKGDDRSGIILQLKQFMRSIPLLNSKIEDLRAPQKLSV